MDYPPNAIVWLSPLALISGAAAVYLWAAVTLLATPAFAWIVVNVVAPRARMMDAAVSGLLFMAWGGVRMLLQFTRLSILLAFSAVWWADSRPLLSGLLLGIALINPR